MVTFLPLNFKKKKLPCLRCFYQESDPAQMILFNCETEGILGTVASIVGTIQANEILKKILSIGQKLKWIYFNIKFIRFKF